MKTAVMANGEWDFEWGRSELDKSKIAMLICADGGGNLAIASGRLPDILVGDLDSITDDNLERCIKGHTEIKKYPKEKDETDLELAVAYAEMVLKSTATPQSEIILYAAGGKRMDHLMGNISLMIGYAQKGLRLKMKDKQSEAWVMVPGKEIIKGNIGQQLSIVPLSDYACISAEGLYYELDRLNLAQHSPRGISNVFTHEEITIEIHEGKALIYRL
ncbi:thiamine diphosphokinase [Dehalobacter sp. DCM]|uniref:thiamine diphosphokinase n=1 Tax=Dehalobacter sp. DCM TaxID=2907827 RepID=UPI0030816541|nr:thiamine diphosphokinase [Dehalobacter sp. DCM]